MAISEASLKEKILKFWYWAGRVLPLTAVAVLLFALVFGFDTYQKIIVCGIAIVFATFAFTWWWWVLDTVKRLYAMLNTAQDRFNEVINELKTLRADINDSDRERNKSDKD